jgi:hypothetical protein
MRNPIQILEQVRDSLPPNILKEYSGRLKEVKESIEYSSPENRALHVRRFMMLFGEIIGNELLTVNSEEWKIKTLAAFMGETVEKTLENIKND